MPMQMSSYRHQDLMPGFATAMERLRRLLDNVQVGYELLAMEQVADGDYGDCLDCGEPIGAGRLRARPEAPFCLTCASSRGV